METSDTYRIIINTSINIYIEIYENEVSNVKQYIWKAM